MTILEGEENSKNWSFVFYGKWQKNRWPNFDERSRERRSGSVHFLIYYFLENETKLFSSNHIRRTRIKL